VARSPAARSWARAPWLSGGCAGQGDWRWGSPRRWHDDRAERHGRTTDVRAAPKWKMAADWEGLTLGGGATMVVGNTPVRATVAQSPTWMRGGSLGRARRRVRGEKRKGGRGTAVGPFEAEEGEAKDGGSGVDAAWKVGMGKREGGWAWCGTARRCGNGRQWLTRGARGRCGVATSRDLPNRGGTRRLTGGPQPQCRAAAPADRWARFNSV
jgi:hypothetical protein